MTTARNRFESIFRELGASMGVDLMPDKNGVVTLSVGDDVALSIEVPPDSAWIYFHSPVQRLAGGDRAGQLEAAMNSNLFGLAVPGAWLALDRSSDELLLCYSTPGKDLTAESIVGIVGALGEAVRDARAGTSPRHESIASEDEKSLEANCDFIRI